MLGEEQLLSCHLFPPVQTQTKEKHKFYEGG